MATAEQELAMLESRVDAELRAAGLEVRDECLEQKLARLKDAALRQRERAEAGIAHINWFRRPTANLRRLIEPALSRAADGLRHGPGHGRCELCGIRLASILWARSDGYTIGMCDGCYRTEDYRMTATAVVFLDRGEAGDS